MRSSLIFTRRPPMNTSRCLPGGAPIWDEGKRRLMATPAVVAAAFLMKSLRFGMSSPAESDVRECAPLANTPGWDEVNQFDSHSKSDPSAGFEHAFEDVGYNPFIGPRDCEGFVSQSPVIGLIALPRTARSGFFRSHGTSRVRNRANAPAVAATLKMPSTAIDDNARLPSTKIARGS